MSMKPTDHAPSITHLTALSASRAVLDALARGVSLRVLGLYTSSANLLCGDQVFSLVEPSARNLPRGILVRLPAGFTWKTTAISPGEWMDVQGPFLRLSPRVLLDLSRAEIWEPRRSLGDGPFNLEAIGGAVAGALPALAGAGGMGALVSQFHSLAAGLEPTVFSSDLFLGRGAQLLSRTMSCILTADEEGLLRAAAGLVGLGIGLTPSGDDILTGLVGSLVLLAERVPELAWFPRASARLVEEARGKTTDVGLTYLSCAAEGEIAELQEGLLRAVVNGDARAAGDACRELRAFGHSSGGEIALGTLLAAQAAAWVVHNLP